MNKQYAVAIATDARLLMRGSESLIGIASGLIADGELNNREIQFLSLWLSENQALATTWPGEVIYKRVREVLTDGVITEEERDYLQKSLTELVGGAFSEDGAIASGSTDLPIDQSAVVQIQSLVFCFTGQFLFGTRTACEQTVTQRGGRVSSVNKNLNFLVVGELSSRDWKYSSFGRKIESAMKLKQEGVPLAIVTEAQWVRAL
jgi:NAD-dependent DNA ligase